VTASAPNFGSQFTTVAIVPWLVETADFALAPGQLKTPELCDIDGDGCVNATDVQLTINKALGLAINGEADVNRSGSVDAIDVQMAINKALGLR